MNVSEQHEQTEGRRNGRGDWVRFLGTWARSPLKMGAIAGSSATYCREMVRRSTTELDGPILELGPGLGPVTRALIEAGVEPERITSVEYDGEFAANLKRRFPRVNVIHGDGLDLTQTLDGRHHERFATVLLAIPIIPFPQARRQALIQSYFQRIRPGGNLTQLSYSPVPPVRPDPAGIEVSVSPVIWANLPPARVWIYNRVGEAAANGI